MRRLIYVPIIHTDSDMGSLTSALSQSTAALCGEERWERHQATASRFWQSVSDYLEELDAKRLKIYQDGLASEGDLGDRIIAEGVRRGSKNYEIILKLRDRGARIVSTESIALLQEEYGHVSQVIRAESASEKRLAYKQYESRKDQLIGERDGFIAGTINEALENGETGLLFLGAYHDVVPQLAEDIVVEQVKEREKVKAYFDELMYGRDERNFKRLTEYLNAEVGAGLVPAEPEH